MSKLSTCTKQWALCIVLAALAGGLTGCQGPTSKPGGIARKSNTIPCYMVSIDDLAKKLGLTVTATGEPFYELKNANNRVVLFMHKDGRVYANGAPVCPVGPVVDVKGMYYVSEILLSQIRPYLNNGTPAWKPTPTPPPSKWTPRTVTGIVVIDAGHGGKDPGATSVLGYYEKGFNLSIAKRLAAILQKRGVQVIMTRQGDTFIELNDRADVANNAGADLFVSLHADSHQDSAHRGFTVYVAKSASQASWRLGRSIENALSSVGVPSKGVRTADFRVLVRTSCPAVLVECGFLSNRSEAGMLNDATYQDRLAAAIADAIIGNL